MDKKIVTGAEAMKAAGADWALTCKPGEIWLLFGDLGSGKTTFVQGAAEALGVKDKVTSPTFNIVAEYQVKDGMGFMSLVHADLYRLSVKQAKVDPAVRDLREERENKLTVVEWGDRWPADWEYTGEMHFSYGNQAEERIIETRKHGQG